MDAEGMEMIAAIVRNLDSIATIKTNLAAGNISRAAEAWFELPDVDKHTLWKAPSKGGVFTTEQRNIMQSSQFRIAFYGQ